MSLRSTLGSRFLNAPAGLRAADIRKHGLQVKIKLYQGKILDGQNRCKALKALAEDGEFKFSSMMFAEFVGTPEQAESFVISTNSPTSPDERQGEEGGGGQDDGQVPRREPAVRSRRSAASRIRS